MIKWRKMEMMVFEDMYQMYLFVSETWRREHQWLNFSRSGRV
jgi:hypothetical protein